MRYLVYNTEAEALSDEATMVQRAFLLAKQIGYVEHNKEMKGKTNGVDRIDAVGTSRWSIPKQRLDGKWVMPHPETHPSTKTVEGYNFIMNGIFAPVEEYQYNWFPEEE